MFSQTTLTSNDCPITRNQSKSIQTNEVSSNIIYEIIVGNYQMIVKLINSSNANDIIDNKNYYTALDYAIQVKNNQIIEYLLRIGTNPYKLKPNGKNSIDTAIEFNNKFFIEKILAKKDNELDLFFSKYDNLTHKTKQFEKTNSELINLNTNLTNANELLRKENNKLKSEIIQLDTIISDTKRKLESSEKAFGNLLKKTKNTNT